MLVVGIFLFQPAYAQLAPANQPVFMAGDWVLVGAHVAMPTELNETSLTVDPAITPTPGHLKLDKDNLLNAGITGVAGIAPLKKGGFQNIEIVLLIKSALPANPQYIHIPNRDGILLSSLNPAICYNTSSDSWPRAVPEHTLVSKNLEVGTIIKGPSWVSKSVNKRDSLHLPGRWPADIRTG